MLPGPTNVPERILRAMYVPMINHRSDDFVELYEDCVEKTKKVFMTEGEAVCLSASGTGAVEASVVNLIKKGDKVIIPVNGEFSSRLSQMLEWAGANVIKLETQPGENASFESVKEAFDNNKDVKAFYCVWNETSTGTMINYLDKVKDLTSRNDSYYVVDGVSIVGGEELKVDKWGVDIAMTGAQKAFAAPPGISPIVVNERTKKYMIENPPDFLIKSSAPSFNPKSSSISSSFEVKKSIGIFVFFLNLLSSSSPSILGILISITAKSGGFLLIPISAFSASI